MKTRGALAFVCVAACGGQGLDGIDSGADDSGAADVGVDSTIGDAGVDVVAVDASDGGIEATVDASIDAPYVDLDAASAPWVQDLGAGALLGVAVDSNLDVLVVGELVALSEYASFYVQELDSNGNTLWSKSAGSSNGFKQHVGLGAAFDSSGNMFASGITDDAIDVGGGSIGPGTFIVKYDPNGKFVWQFGPFQGAQFSRIATRSNGHIIAVGNLQVATDFGKGTLTPSGYGSALMVEMDNNKKLVDAKIWGTTSGVTALAVDHYDNLFMTGRFENTLDFGGGSMFGPTDGSSFNTFIAKLDLTNAYAAQMQAAASSNNDGLNSIVVDWANDVWVTGYVGNTMNLGGKDLTCGGTVMGRLDNALKHIWSGCYTHGSGGVLAISPINTAFLGGSYGGTINFGQGTLPGTQGSYLVSFDSTGKATASFGTSWQNGNLAMSDTTYLTWPDFVVAGQCSGSFSLPSGPVTCGGQHAFVARLTP